MDSRRIENQCYVCSHGSTAFWDDQTQSAPYGASMHLPDADSQCGPATDNILPADLNNQSGIYNSMELPFDLAPQWPMYPQAASSHSQGLEKYGMRKAVDVQTVQQPEEPPDIKPTESSDMAAARAQREMVPPAKMDRLVYTDMDAVCDFMVHRLRQLTSDPASQIFHQLLAHLVPDRRDHHKYQVGRKPALKGGPRWFHANPWDLPWYPGPFRMNIENATLATAYIFMLPYYAPEHVHDLVNNLDVTPAEVANTPTPWNTLLNQVLGDISLSTKYHRKKNDKAGERIVPGRGNTTYVEIDARRLVVGQLLDVALDVEMVVNGYRDKKTYRSIQKLPDSIRQAPYGSRDGRNSNKTSKRKARVLSLEERLQDSTENLDSSATKRVRNSSQARKVTSRRKKSSAICASKRATKSTCSTSRNATAGKKSKFRRPQSSQHIKCEEDEDKNYLMVPANESDVERQDDDTVEPSMHKVMQEDNKLELLSSETAEDTPSTPTAAKHSFSDVPLASDLVGGAEADVKNNFKFIPEQDSAEPPLIPFLDGGAAIPAAGFATLSSTELAHPVQQCPSLQAMQPYCNAYHRDLPPQMGAFTDHSKVASSPHQCGIEYLNQLGPSPVPEAQLYAVLTPNPNNTAGGDEDTTTWVNSRDVYQLKNDCHCGRFWQENYERIARNFPR